MQDRSKDARAFPISLYSYLVLLTAIMFGFWRAPAWAVVGMATLLLMLPALPKDLGNGQFFAKHGPEHQLTLELAVTAVNALVFAIASYEMGRGIAWLLMG